MTFNFVIHLYSDYNNLVEPQPPLISMEYPIRYELITRNCVFKHLIGTEASAIYNLNGLYTDYNSIYMENFSFFGSFHNYLAQSNFYETLFLNNWGIHAGAISADIEWNSFVNVNFIGKFIFNSGNFVFQDSAAIFLLGNFSCDSCNFIGNIALGNGAGVITVYYVKY